MSCFEASSSVKLNFAMNEDSCMPVIIHSLVRWWKYPPTTLADRQWCKTDTEVFASNTVTTCRPVSCEAYSFTADGYGIFNVRTNLGVCCMREGGVRHKQVCTRVDSEGQEKLPHHPDPPGDRAQGSGIWIPALHHWATPPHFSQKMNMHYPKVVLKKDADTWLFPTQ